MTLCISSVKAGHRAESWLTGYGASGGADGVPDVSVELPLDGSPL